MSKKRWILGTAVLFLLGGAACSSDSANVGLAFSTRSAAVSNVAGDSAVIVRGNDTVIIRSVELVLREIELKRVDDLAGCADVPEVDDACEEFSVGLQLVSLPLGNGTDKVLTVNVGAGTYDEVQFEIHKPDNQDDAAFIAAHPAFSDISIRVTGTFSQAGTRSNFTYTTSLNAEQRIDLNPPLDVAADGDVNLTIRLDIGTWFLNGLSLVNPATANAGGANENLVRDNIEASIQSFRDNDADGLDDDHEDDDHGSSHDSP